MSCDITTLLEKCDIACIQELWLTKQELSNEINNISHLFHGSGVSPIDEGDGVISGRKYGGVAILWRTSIENHIEEIEIDSELDWLCGIYINIGNSKLLILNVYLLYERVNFNDQYLEYQSKTESIVQKRTTTAVIIIGDFYADISKRLDFGPILKIYCNYIIYL